MTQPLAGTGIAIMDDAILELRDVTKIYPGVRAMDRVSLSFRRGEVHAIVGENGAGKSTLIKTLTGAIQPSSGAVVLDGVEHAHFTPGEAMRLGVGVIYQEFNLIPFLSVAQNIFYGREPMKGLFINAPEMNKRTGELCRRMDIDLNPRARVKDLGVAHQQIVEILKAVSQNARILIMDEPTAPLTHGEIESLFRIVRNLKESGVTVIYISHRLEEIFEICDRVTVMRDGQYVSTQNTADTDMPALIAAMVGRELGADYPKTPVAPGEVVLSVRGLTTDVVNGVSFDLRRGEILGLGGLVGAGRTETARAIFGADQLKSGEVLVRGSRVAIATPRDAIARGIGLITEDRKSQGLVLGMRVDENISYTVLDRHSTFGFLHPAELVRVCGELVEELRIKITSLGQKVNTLSGGNQQKVALAKWLARDCDIIIFDEPTRGIDVGAKREIYQLMQKLAEAGKGLIMISSEMPELIGMSDRIIVMCEGRVTGELTRNDFTQDRILTYASMRKQRSA
ncbi:MAG: sugar ABC transporter ATP-binding protein [Planctomycetota bacterium]|jgi:ribose transport system ATP-binding protein|nr:sugar ABC transporter ATP-binding protein [Planctomycetota bacterium]